MSADTIEKTSWNPQFPDGEYSLSGANFLVDASGNNLADASGNQIVTTDTSFTHMDSSVWSQNDGS